MMPPTKNRRGTHVIDVMIPGGVGRLKRATGTTDRMAIEDMRTMLRKLTKDRRFDILRLIKDGDLSLLEALDRFERHDLEEIPVGEAVLSVESEWQQYLKVKKCPARVKQDIAYTLTALLGRGDEKRAGLMLSELPDRLEELIVEKGDFPRTCKKMKVHVQGFLNWKLGDDHPLYARVREMGVPEQQETRQPPLLSPDEVRELIGKMRLGGADVWSLCLTGMLPNREYHLDWQIVGTTVHIPGKKTKNRNRTIPLFGDVTRPSLHPRTLADVVREASGGTVQPKDFRNFFANWCLMAGIEELRVEQYMGHRPATMTRHYARGVPRPAFLEDIAKFQAYVGPAPAFQQGAARRHLGPE